MENIKKIILLPLTAKKRKLETIILEQMRFGFTYFIYRTINVQVLNYYQK
jgi:hypothetical protein